MDARRFLGDAARSVGAALLFLGAALLSRETVIIDPGPSSLMWPAAGIAVVWFLTAGRAGVRLLDVVLLLLVEAEVAFLAGGRGLVLAVVVGSAVLGTLATTTIVRWLEPSLADPAVAPLRTPRAVVRFLLGAMAGCAVGVAVGTIGLGLVRGDWQLGATLFAWSRNVCGVLAVGVSGLLLVDHLRTRPRARLLGNGSAPELLLVITASAALTVADWLSGLPVAFLLPAVTVWAATRFPPLLVCLHALLGSGATLWLTSHGHGPFGQVEPVRTAALLAQVFVSSTLLKGLLLAASRESNDALQAERMDREREQREALLSFARRAAHDLKGPLAVVEGWSAELVETARGDLRATAAGVPAMADRILTASRQASALVSELLADAAAQDRAPHRDCVDLTSLAREVAAGHRARADICVDELGAVGGDAVLLRQVLENLLDNAAKYVRRGERAVVSLTGRRVGDVVVVRVTDEGVGVPPGQHERIFDEFQRARTDLYPGTGLGLSICRRIVERHGGRIRALDRDDGRTGAVFEMTLPAWGSDLRPRLKVTT